VLNGKSLQHLDLALSCAPLLKHLTGDKRERLQRAFICSADHLGLAIMPELEGRLPVTAKEAALELHKAVLDLCCRAGLRGQELVENYNNIREGASYGPGTTGEAAERALALLAIFHARKITEPQG